jgi:hypothetical protein
VPHTALTHAVSTLSKSHSHLQSASPLSRPRTRAPQPFLPRDHQLHNQVLADIAKFHFPLGSMIQNQQLWFARRLITRSKKRIDLSEIVYVSK